MDIGLLENATRPIPMLSSMQHIMNNVIENALYRQHMFRWIAPMRSSLQVNGSLVKLNDIKLGRWNYNVTKEQLERRIDLANTDNCAYMYSK